MTCTVLDVVNMVQIFHAARQILALGPTRIFFYLLTSYWRLSSEHGVVSQPFGWLKFTVRSVVVGFVIVSITSPYNPKSRAHLHCEYH